MSLTLRSAVFWTIALYLVYLFLYQVFFLIVAVGIVYTIIDYIIRWPMVPNIQDKYVLITGTSSGLGRHCVKQLDKLGCHVLACARSEKGEKELQSQCSDRLRLVRLDITSPDSIRQVVDQVKAILPKGRGLWGLVNNAAVSGKRGRFEWLTAVDFQEANQTNLYGVIDLTLKLLPLIKQEKGRVVNVSSFGGRVAMPYAVPYTVSKFGVECLTDVLRFTLKDYGIHVSVIEPAGFSTAINSLEATQASLDYTWSCVPKEVKEEFGEDYYRSYCKGYHSTLPKPETLARLDEVAKTYEEALFCRFPRPRYVKNAYTDAILIVPYLPEWIQDRIVDAAFPMFNALPAFLCKK